ncbi:pilus assembly protein TadG-related protein [Zhengella sp. ZM62]|uniref:TadE/TadG family type IV pilus assembly protein n=1 Tax=Zhengella sedimenti TaxID=3390035 RepID=UPI0039754CC8
MTIHGKFLPFLRDRGGNFVTMFAVAAIPLIGSIAMAVDYSNMDATRDSLQNAADAGVLMAARYYEDNGKMPEEKAVRQFIRANTEVKNVDLTRLHRGTNGQIYVTVKAPYDPFIMHAIWDRDYTIKVKAVAVAGQDQIIEVAMALDITKSMKADDKIGGLKIAAKNFTNTLFDAASENADVKIGVVPFDDYVKVGTQYKNEKWLKLPPPDDPRWYDMRKEMVEIPGSCKMVYEDTDGVWEYVRRCQYDEIGPEIRVDLEWYGCVGSRGTKTDKLALQDEPFNRTSWPDNYRFPGIVNMRCGTPLLPLTEKKQNVLDTIDALYPYEETYIADGVMWGLRVLSPVAPFTEGVNPEDAGNGQVRKILIVMSDGDNYVAPRLDKSIYNEYHNVRDVPMADEWTREACEHTKSRGVEVFSIAYGKEISANGKKVLQDCASSGAHYFDAASASALNTTFQKIAEAITRLRLVK